MMILCAALSSPSGSEGWARSQALDDQSFVLPTGSAPPSPSRPFPVSMYRSPVNSPKGSLLPPSPMAPDFHHASAAADIAPVLPPQPLVLAPYSRHAHGQPLAPVLPPPPLLLAPRHHPASVPLPQQLVLSPRHRLAPQQPTPDRPSDAELVARYLPKFVSPGCPEWHREAVAFWLMRQFTVND